MAQFIWACSGSTSSVDGSVGMQQVTLPDLIVTNVSYSNGTLTTTMLNQGSAATATEVSLAVSYWLDGAQFTSGTVVGPLAPGASVTVGSEGQAYSIPSGIHTVIAVVDQENLVAESKEDNNQLSATIGDSLPDLVVTGLSFANGVFTGTVLNQGDAETPTGISLHVTYWVDGVQVAWGEAPGPVLAGDSVTLGTESGLYVMPAGIHTIMAFADDENRIAESEENNNQHSKTSAMVEGG